MDSPPSLQTLCLHQLADDCILKGHETQQLDWLPLHLQTGVEDYFRDEIQPQVSQWRRQQGNYYDNVFELFAVDVVEKLILQDEPNMSVPVVNFVDRLCDTESPWARHYSQQMDTMRAGFNSFIPQEESEEEEEEEWCTCDRYTVVSTLLGFRNFQWDSLCRLDREKSAAAATIEVQGLCRHTKDWIVPVADFSGGGRDALEVS